MLADMVSDVIGENTEREEEEEEHQCHVSLSSEVGGVLVMSHRWQKMIDRLIEKWNSVGRSASRCSMTTPSSFKVM